MKILVVGGGGREHAIVWAFSRSRRVKNIFCAPGNAGIADLAECVAISATDVAGLADFAENNGIDLTFVGGETSLALGVADEFEKRGLKIVGASRRAAQLESSKVFAKDFMARHGVPTAKFRTASTAAEAKEILAGGEFGDKSVPVVIKADGLAAGKGVVVAKDHAEAEEAIDEIMSGSLVGKDAAAQIVLEEALTGHEVSLLLFADGRDYALMPPARDHKRIGEGNTGPNTGGMGVITDGGLLSADELKIVKDQIIEPTLAGAIGEGFPFKGILFLGLMMTPAGPRLLEYNVRFGDPETQAILIRLETDIVDISEAIVSGNLMQTDIVWKDGCSAVVVLAARGYPAKPEYGEVIEGLEKAKSHQKVMVFHAGTKTDGAGNIVTAGGRVLGVTATASNLSGALHRCYKAVIDIHWDGLYYRRDIGKSGLQSNY